MGLLAARKFLVFFFLLAIGFQNLNAQNSDSISVEVMYMDFKTEFLF